MEKKNSSDNHSNDESKTTDFRAGFISIVGAPNVGKSTFLNRVMEGHFAIVTDKPQTTRTVIRAIKNLDNAQMIFIDTPGLHTSQKAFNKILIQSALNACKESDVVLALISAEKIHHEETEFLLTFLRDIRQTPLVLAINKIDKLELPDTTEISKDFSSLPNIKGVYPISALLGSGIDPLLKTLAELLPKSPPLFPPDMETDMTERFFASEIIREKIFLLTKDEIPYEIAVEIDQFKEDKEKNMLVITAIIHVNRPSQKRIIIGKDGDLIKKIGMAARKDLEEFFHIHVYLDLWVRVNKNWMKNPRMLREFGIITR